MSVSVGDIAPKKYWWILILVTFASMLFIALSPIHHEIFSNTWKNLIVSWASLAKYIGLLLILVTSVVWKWNKDTNHIPISSKFKKNSDDELKLLCSGFVEIEHKLKIIQKKNKAGRKKEPKRKHGRSVSTYE